MSSVGSEDTNIISKTIYEKELNYNKGTGKITYMGHTWSMELPKNLEGIANKESLVGKKVFQVMAEFLQSAKGKEFVQSMSTPPTSPLVNITFTKDKVSVERKEIPSAKPQSPVTKPDEYEVKEEAYATAFQKVQEKIQVLKEAKKIVEGIKGQGFQKQDIGTAIETRTDELNKSLSPTKSTDPEKQERNASIRSQIKILKTLKKLVEKEQFPARLPDASPKSKEEVKKFISIQVREASKAIQRFKKDEKPTLPITLSPFSGAPGEAKGIEYFKTRQRPAGIKPPMHSEILPAPPPEEDEEVTKARILFEKVHVEEKVPEIKTTQRKHTVAEIQPFKDLGLTVPEGLNVSKGIGTPEALREKDADEWWKTLVSQNSDWVLPPDGFEPPLNETQAHFLRTLSIKIYSYQLKQIKSLEGKLGGESFLTKEKEIASLEEKIKENPGLVSKLSNLKNERLLQTRDKNLQVELSKYLKLKQSQPIIEAKLKYAKSIDELVETEKTYNEMLDSILKGINELQPTKKSLKARYKTIIVDIQKFINPLAESAKKFLHQVQCLTGNPKELEDLFSAKNEEYFEKNLKLAPCFGEILERINAGPQLLKQGRSQQAKSTLMYKLDQSVKKFPYQQVAT